jgi:hypothetical protein
MQSKRDIGWRKVSRIKTAIQIESCL